MIDLRCGDWVEVLKTLPDESVNCVVTSPPYWGLRDYGIAGQLGLEKTPEEYVAKIVTGFREVRRVLRKDGTLWLNLGDSYAGSGRGRDADGTRGEGQENTKQGTNRGAMAGRLVNAKSLSKNLIEEGAIGNAWVKPAEGLKPKDLVGIPWRVAFALQADGWVLRSDNIWAKPNPMPESVRDRCTKSHEYIFMLSKGKWVGDGEPSTWMPEIDKAWLAALVDGEGSICFQEKMQDGCESNWSVRLSICNTNRELLERAASICNVGGGPGTPSPRHRSTGESNRPIYSWQVTNAKAASVIAAIRPYLIAKKIQADLALSVQILNQKHKGRGGYKTTESDILFKRKAAEACSSLNHGGEPDIEWFTPLEWGHWDSRPYVYDADAIKEPSVINEDRPFGVVRDREYDYDSKQKQLRGRHVSGKNQKMASMSGGGAPQHDIEPSTSRNKRSVWTIATQPFSAAHFATFPEKLVEPCILAGCPEGGTVLDPFAGTCTVGLVAARLNRSFIGIDLNPEYLKMRRKQIDAIVRQERMAV